MFIQQTFPVLLLWVFVANFLSFRFPKSLVFLIVTKRETNHIYHLKFMTGQRQKYNPQKNPWDLYVLPNDEAIQQLLRMSAKITWLCVGEKIDQSTKFLRVACVIFYWCVFTLSFSSLFSFCWIDFPLVVHSTRWDNGINWRILFSIDEPFTYPQHKHWKPPLPRQTASRKVSPLINPSFINHRTVFYCL